MKGFRHKSEEKVEKTNWLKVGGIILCVVMAVFMVVSMFGTSWLSIFSLAKPGNTALVDYTIYDNQERPVVTTDQRYFTNEHEGVTLLASPLTVKVNITTNEDMVPVQVSNPYNQYGLIDFLVFGPELDAISTAITGMKLGETKTIDFPWAESMVRTMSEEQFANISGSSYENAKVGEQVPIAFTGSPQINLDNSTPSSYLRTSTVIARDNGNVTLSYGYPKVSITLTQLNA